MSLNRLVALKLIRSGDFADEKEISRFRSEAEAAANLDHPNIVPIYEVGADEGRHYFSMKLIEGGSLSERISNLKSLISNREAANLLATVARAVHYAHQRGLLHRDLKPGNILLAPDSQPRITDFGLAKRIDTDSALTQSGTIVGTPSYVAPEQAAGAKQLTTGADIYSLGAILYELLAGRPPFTGATVMETLQKVMNTEPVPPSVICSSRRKEALTKGGKEVQSLVMSAATNIDRDLETICLKCLEKEPARRYGSAEALAEDLERWLARKPIRARPVTPGERLHKWARRNPLLASGAVALFLVGALGFAGILWQWRRAEGAVHQTREQLWHSYLDQSRAERLTGMAGARERALTAITNAASIRSSVALRNEAIAALSLTDTAHGLVNDFLPGADGAALFDAALKVFVVPATNGEVLVGEVQSGRLTARLPTRAQKVHFLAIRSDARYVGVFQDNGIVALWDLASRQELWRDYAPPVHGATPFVFHPTQPLLVLRTGSNRLRLLELDSGETKGEVPLPWEPMRFAFSPEGGKVALTRGDQCEAWDVNHHSSLGRFTHQTCLDPLVWHPDGRHLALGDCSGAVVFWNVASGAREIWMGDPHHTFTLAFNPAGTLLHSGHWSSVSELWDVASGQRLTQQRSELGQQFSADGKSLGWLSSTAPIGHPSVSIGRSSVNEPVHLRTLTVPLGSRSGNSVAFSPNGRYLAAGDADGIRLWDATSAELLDVASVKNKVYEMNFSHDGHWLLTKPLNQTREPNKFYRWPLTTNAATGSLAIGAAERIDAGNVIVLDGSLGQSGLGHLFPTDMNNHVFGPGARFADLRDPFQLYELRPVPDGVWSLSRTTNWIALCGPQVLQIQRLAGETLKIPTQYRGGLVLLSPDNTRLAHFSSGVLEMFSTDTRRLLWSRAQETDATALVAFSHDGRLLAASGGPGAMICLSDSATGEEVATLTPQVKLEAAGLAFSPDDQTLAVSHGRMILLWDLPALRLQLRTLGLDWRDEDPSGSFARRQP